MISSAPIRFTADIDRMRTFLELLGFKAHIVSERDGWVEMHGDVSIINLHGADREESSVGFVTDEPLEDLHQHQSPVLTRHVAVAYSITAGQVQTLQGPS